MYSSTNDCLVTDESAWRVGGWWHGTLSPQAKSTGDAGSSVRRRRWWWRPWAEPDPDEGELSVTHPQHHWMLSGLLAASALQVGLVVYVAAAYWLSRRAVGAR